VLLWLCDTLVVVVWLLVVVRVVVWLPLMLAVMEDDSLPDAVSLPV
jgi:hypothetical protein